VAELLESRLDSQILVLGVIIQEAPANPLSTGINGCEQKPGIIESDIRN